MGEGNTTHSLSPGSPPNPLFFFGLFSSAVVPRSFSFALPAQLDLVGAESLQDVGNDGQCDSHETVPETAAVAAR